MITIGIDLGTSAVKLLAMNEQGQVIKIISREYPLYLYNEGWSEQDPDDWWRETAEGIRLLTAELPPDEISACSFSGQMHGLVALDGYDQVLRRAILWNDQRTQSQCDFLNNTVGREKLLEHTANIALTGFTAPKLLWMKDNEPELFARIKKVMLPKDYIAYKLSGVFATDYSDASGMLLLDVKQQDWSLFMLETVGLTREQLPMLYPSYAVVGTVRPEAAQLTGLPEHVKVVIGGGDQAVGAVGTGAVGNGMCSLSLGTSGVVFAAADQFSVDRGKSGIHSFCHATGRYHLMGVTLAAAASTKWWVEDILQSGDYNAEQVAIDVLGGNKVFYLPYLNGERTPHNNPEARGAFVGLSLTTTRADMTQAVLEGVAFSLRDVLEIIRNLGVTVDAARIIGGGAKSSLWCRIVANVLNLRVEKINSAEGPAFGAAILAMVGAGAFATVEEACHQLIAVTETFEPDENTVVQYDRQYPVFTALYEALKDTFHAMTAV